MVSNIFYFQPDPWGNDPIWRATTMMMYFLSYQQSLIHHISNEVTCHNRWSSEKGLPNRTTFLVIFDDSPRQYHSVFDTCIMSSYSLVYYTNPFLSILIFFIFFLWRLSPFFPQRTLHLEQADDWTTRRIIIVGDTNRTFGGASIQDPPGYLVDRWMIDGLDEVENIDPWKLRNSQASHILWWPLFIIQQKESERLVHLKIPNWKGTSSSIHLPFFGSKC